MTPRLSTLYAKGEIKRYKRLMFRILSIGTILGVGGILIAVGAGKTILKFLYHTEYADRAHIFVWLMVAGGISYVASILGYGMTAARHFKAQLPLFVLVTLTTYLASIWLIPKYALTGAALSLISGALVQIIGSWIITVFALRTVKKSVQ